MGNKMSKRINDSVEENDISLGHTFVWETPGKYIQPSMENHSYKILEDRQFEWLKFGSDHILSGKASKKSDWNCGCIEQKDVSVSLLQMKYLDGTNMNDIQSYPERRVGYITGLLPQNHQAADDSKKSIHNTQQLTNVLDAEEIFNLVKRGKTRKIPDLENDKGNPMKTSCNTAGYVRGSSETPNNNETEGDIKMSCAMAFRKKF
ncbi:uncharacterized protein LOC127726663 isoform X2 [Mytilus californianus]|nr:uncharacterized protein LOC127726663 isoform X2 [Mytilus californianus]XP_052090076.1 uncharacterized protein LOC127726663 isoform X2 [Mytilus californianus]XP_052090077.1 uncharacterized protein LOC127726663 isoform X2 [Mytilus californianus]